MASIKMGAIITDIKGKVGGTVFQGSKTGVTMKNKSAAATSDGSSKLTKADAGRVVSPQSNMSSIATSWKALSEGNKTSWNMAAPDFPFTNKYGVPYTGSGFQLFMSVNSNRLVIGEPILNTAPAVPILDNMAPFGLNWTTLIAFTLIPTADIPADAKCQLYATRGMSAGRAPKPGDFRLIEVIATWSGVTHDIQTQYIAQFGTPIPGSTVWVQGKLTKADAGRNGLTYSAKVQTPL